MLTIPFLTARATRKSSRIDRNRRAAIPDLDALLKNAKNAVRENKPSMALSILAPVLESDDIPADVYLVAGHALSGMGRYPEALDHYENFISFCPGSVRGLIAAGLAASRVRILAKASEYFGRAALALTGRAKTYLESITGTEKSKAVEIETMVAEVESNPEDTDMMLALACALGQAGHFRAVERFLPKLD